MAACGIDRDISSLLDLQERVGWRTGNTDEKLHRILDGLAPPSGYTVPGNCMRNGNKSLAVLLSGAARTLTSGEMHRFGQKLRGHFTGPIKLFAWLALAGDNSSGYTETITHDDAKRALQATGFEFVLVVHSQQHELLPPDSAIDGCGLHVAGLTRRQFQKLQAVTAIMARDETQRGMRFSHVLRIRPDYCFGEADRFFRVALPRVHCSSPYVFIVHDALAIYPRHAADTIAAIGSYGSLITLMNTVSSWSLCNSMRRLPPNPSVRFQRPPGRRADGGWHADGARAADRASFHTDSPALATNTPPCSHANPQPLMLCCMASMERRQCALRLWHRLETTGRLRCPTGASPKLDRFRHRRDLSRLLALSYVQFEALMMSGFFAVDLAHWWGSSGLPMSKGGGRASGSVPIAPLEHWGVDQLRRSRLWWWRHPFLVNASALATGTWRTRCASFD